MVLLLLEYAGYSDPIRVLKALKKAEWHSWCHSLFLPPPGASAKAWPGFFQLDGAGNPWIKTDTS